MVKKKKQKNAEKEASLEDVKAMLREKLSYIKPSATFERDFVFTPGEDGTRSSDGVWEINDIPVDDDVIMRIEPETWALVNAYYIGDIGIRTPLVFDVKVDFDKWVGGKK